jgi:hypothetical protein
MNRRNQCVNPIDERLEKHRLHRTGQARCKRLLQLRGSGNCDGTKRNARVQVVEARVMIRLYRRENFVEVSVRIRNAFGAFAVDDFLQKIAKCVRLQRYIDFYIRRESAIR